ncbi:MULTISPECIES: TRAP transporter small permease subunit [unclassified Agarivorans]|uniref:TRAP transporter small permease subunit n=1 Tax=unclassified Agarivorans TaxID=2636026 RepID=UPI003D7C7597
MKRSFSEKIDHLCVSAGEWVSILFIVVVVIGFFEVVMRYVFNSPTNWVHETTTFLVSISLIYGGVSCYASNKHICMDFIRQRFRRKTQWWMELLVELLTFVFMLMLTYGSFCATKDAFFSPFGKFKMQTSGSVIDTPFPALNKGFFFLSCLVMLLLCVTHIYRHIVKRNDRLNLGNHNA